MVMLTLIVALTVVANLAAAHEKYTYDLPNGNNVDGFAAVGHKNSDGGGSENRFGGEFHSAGKAWTRALCEADSDGDGQTNGEELGDPCCEWVRNSNEVLQRSTGLSSPGHASSTSDESVLAAVNCSAIIGIADTLSPNAFSHLSYATSIVVGGSISATAILVL